MKILYRLKEKHKNKTTVKRWSVMKLEVRLHFFVFRQSGKIFFDSPVINTEKLVCSGGHVNIVRFPLCPFLVHKGVNGIIRRRTLNKAIHYLEEGLSQVWRSLL